MWCLFIAQILSLINLILDTIIAWLQYFILFLFVPHWLTLLRYLTRFFFRFIISHFAFTCHISVNLTHFLCHHDTIFCVLWLTFLRPLTHFFASPWPIFLGPLTHFFCVTMTHFFVSLHSLSVSPWPFFVPSGPSFPWVKNF